MHLLLRCIELSKGDARRGDQKTSSVILSITLELNDKNSTITRAPSGVDLTFATLPPGLCKANVKSKTPLETDIC